jgi:hypothetical protein
VNGSVTGDTPWTKRLDEVGASNPAEVGAKAHNLGQLLGLGFPVPAGFVVVASAYRQAVQFLGVTSGAVTATQAEDIRSALLTFEFSCDDEFQLYASYDNFQVGGGGVCAVRSSATAEDSAQASFAGLYDTYYGVDRLTLAKQVRACWASVWTERALAYRQRHGIEHRDVAMAVIVQKQVNASSAGTAFTVHLVTADTSQVLIESVWGKGSVLADGRADPDRFAVQKEDLRVTMRRVGRKQVRVSDADDESLVEVPAAQRVSVSLTDAEIETICRWSLTAEQHFAMPQDVEWAVDDGVVSILQSRPVTALPAIGPDEVVGSYVIFKPALENFTELFTPLSADLLSSTPFLGARIIMGWFYWDVALLRPFIPLRLTDADFTDLLCLSASADKHYKIAWHKVPLCLIGLALGYLAFGVFYARTRNLLDDFMDCFRRRVDELEQDEQVSALDAARTVFVPRHVFERVGMQVLLVNFSAARYLFALAGLRWCLRRWVSGLGEDLVSRVSTSTSGVLSADMGLQLQQLARQARIEPAVQEALKNAPPDECLQHLQKLSAAKLFLEGFDKFLVTYGHRGPRELEFAAPRFSEEPTPLLAMVASYLQGDPLDGGLASRRLDEQKKLGAAIDGQLSVVKLWLVNYLSGRARYFSKLCENSRFHHILGFALVRKRVLVVAKQLVRNAKLDCESDVFFLQVEEL